MVLPLPLGPSSARISPRRERERHAVHREVIAEAAGQPLEGDERLGHGRPVWRTCRSQ